jgi:hypothetical protein
LAGAPVAIFALAPVILAIARSAFIYPRPFARALVYELLVNGLATIAALVLYDRSAIGAAFSLWSFWLVQAGFALVPGAAHACADPIDPFDRAHAAAIAVLERRAR